MELPSPAREAIHDYLSAADEAAPGCIEALYVVGSIPLGDYQPAISDVDLVAVWGERPPDAQLEALGRIPRPSHPSVDVLYVTRDELRSDPTGSSPPHSLLGTFARDGGFEANPATWRSLAVRSIAVRGPELKAEDVWFDADVLRQWNVANLDSYWASQIDQLRRRQPSEALVRHESGLQWLVLGVPRLHYTIATLGVTSKTGAGVHALGVADSRWHQVIEACIALRADRDSPLPKSPAELCDDAAQLSGWLIHDAHRLMAAQPS